MVGFEGTSVDGLEKDFQEAVDDYLDTCREMGKAPDKPFSGRIILDLKRLPVPILERFKALALELRVAGPVRDGWPNYGKIRGAGDCHHCHIKKADYNGFRGALNLNLNLNLNSDAVSDECSRRDSGPTPSPSLSLSLSSSSSLRACSQGSPKSVIIRKKGKTTYVAVWKVKDDKILEVTYVGTHEVADYRRLC